MDDRSY